MAYNGQTWQSTAGADRRGEFAMAGGQALAQGIAAAGQSFTDLLKQKINAKQETDFITAQWDKLPNKTPEDDQKFHSGSLSTKRGLYTSAVTWMNEQMQGNEKAAAEMEAKRRWDLTHNLQSQRVANEGAYRQAQVENMNKPPLPVKSEWRDTGGGIMQHFKNDQPTGAIYKIPGKPGMVPLENAPDMFVQTDGSGKPMDNGRTYRREPDAFSQSGYAFTPVDEQSAVKTPTAPDGWKPFGNSAAGTFIRKGDQIAKWDEDVKKWVATEMPDAAPAPAPAANPPAPAARRWRSR